MKKLGVMLAVSLATCAVSADSRLNVRDFGARGDGVTDDYAAFQKAFDRANALRRKDAKTYGLSYDSHGVPAVFVPQGTYRLSRPLLAHVTFFLTGEKGSELVFADGSDVGIYVEHAFRVTVRGLKFRGGRTQFAFWTANEDTASILVENCAFEGCADESIWTEAWSTKELKTAKDTEDLQFTMHDIGPYDISTDAEGFPVLTRAKREYGSANSTRFCLHNATFLNCGAAYRGGCDETCVDHVQFRSERAQRLPIWNFSSKIRITDVRMLANIPQGYPHGWLEVGDAYVDALRVRADSSTAFGAPLCATKNKVAKDRIWGGMSCVGLEDCSAEVAGSDSNALVLFRHAPPDMFELKDCREANGAKIRMFAFTLPLETEADLRRALKPGESGVPSNLAHRWIVHGNGPEVEANVPAILRPLLETPVPDEVLAEFPKLDLPNLAPNRGPYDIIDAEDFGIRFDGWEEDASGRFQALFDAAAKAANPLVRLPGRTIQVAKTMTIPRKIRIECLGRAVLKCNGRGFTVFKVADGDAPLAITFDGLVISQGDIACEAEGEGEILFRNGGLAFNRGFRVKRRGGPLRLEGIDTTIRGPRFAESDGADVRLKDSWTKYSPEKDIASFFHVRGGTLTVEGVLGTPITGRDPFKLTRLDWLKDGEYAYWIRNEGGVVRTRHYLYGPEFGGLGIAENFGAGKVLVERNQAGWGVGPSSDDALIRNRDKAGTVVISTLSLMHQCYGPRKLCTCAGVKPSRHYDIGTRTIRNDWEKADISPVASPAYGK